LFPVREAPWQEIWPLERSIEFCVKQGIRRVEMMHFTVESLEEHELQKFVDSLKQAQVEVVSLHLPFGPECAIENPDRPARLSAVDRHKRCLDICAQMGVPLAVLHPANRTCSDGEVVKANVMRSVEELIPAAEKAGVVLCLENMLPYHPFGSQPEEVASIIEKFSHPNLRAVFDSGHANVAGLVMEVFEAMRPYIAHTHLHDNNGLTDLHVPPGYGSVPWPRLMVELLRLDESVPLYIEAMPWGGSDYRRLWLETTALANACLGPGRFPSLRRPGEDDGWYLRRDAGGGKLIVFDENGRPI